MAGVCRGGGICDTSPNDHGGRNWVSKAGGFPDWFHAIVNAMRRKGKTEGEAIQLAWGIVRNWARGQGHVTAETRAKAAAMVARLDAMRGAAHLTADPTPSIDLAGAWDPSKHPRSHGKFAPKGTQTQPAPKMATTAQMSPELAAQIRDFQKRMGLPITSNFDPRTVSAIHAAQTAKGGGGGSGGGKGKGGASKAGAAAKKQQAAVKAYLKARQAAAKKAAAAKTKATKTAQTTQARQIKAKAAATANAVNALTPTQRAAYRAKNPPPAGYAWTSKGTLAALSTVAAQKQVAATLAGRKAA